MISTREELKNVIELEKKRIFKKKFNSTIFARIKNL